MKEKVDEYSIREKNLWFQFLVDVAVALYYWPKAFRLMLAGDEALGGPMMVGLITGTVIWAVTISILLSIFLHTQKKPEPKDERDHIIDARSSLLSGWVLKTGMVLIMGTIVIQQIGGDFVLYRNLVTLTPLLIAHLLLVVLMVAGMTSSVARLYYYRRGY